MKWLGVPFFFDSGPYLQNPTWGRRNPRDWQTHRAAARSHANCRKIDFLGGDQVYFRDLTPRNSNGVVDIVD